MMAKICILGLLVVCFQTGQALICYCQGQCPNGHHNGTCKAVGGAGCFAAAEEVYDPETDSLVAHRTYGCLPPDEAGLMMCRANLSPHATPKTIECCKSEDLCNRKLVPMFDSTYQDDDDETNVSSVDPAIFHLVLLCSLTVSIVSLVFLVTCIYIKYKRKEMERSRYIYQATAQSEPCWAAGGSLQKLLETTSGSGTGLPLLVQRTIAKQVQMRRKVGSGRYGEVWLATWRGERVAVKVFLTSEEDSWFRETEIYQSVLMRHDNILGFIAADIKGIGGWSQMLLITDYHQRGSVSDYLGSNVLDLDQMTRLVYSLASGLAHLHTEIFGTKGKPAIAHRDLKASNVLVKSDGTATISDFGLSVRYYGEKQQIDLAPNSRGPTARYLAPEFLDGSANMENFESFKSGDMYSVGLILWQILLRTDTSPQQVVEEWQIPFGDVVPGDATYEDMYQVVCLKAIRPEIPVSWSTSEIPKVITKLMCECWHENPLVRPTALRLKKSLSRVVTCLNPVPGTAVKIV